MTNFKNALDTPEINKIFYFFRKKIFDNKYAGASIIVKKTINPITT